MSSRALRTFGTIMLLLVLTPSLALAAGLPASIVPCGNSGQAQCGVCDLAQLAQNILNAAIYLAVILSAVLFAWAGLMYLTNVANSSGVSRAKEVFTNVVIGLVIIVAAWLVIDVVMRVFVGASLLPWNAIC